LVFDRLQRISGLHVLFERGSVLDAPLVQSIMERHQIAFIVHFAGFKAVGGSVTQPLEYYYNNQVECHQTATSNARRCL
jgi:UDP-glucose 4-epimerase